MYIRFRKREKQRKAWWVMRHPIISILFVGIVVTPLACGLWPGPPPDARTEFDVCTDGADKKEDCKKLLRFSLLKSNSWVRDNEGYYSDPTSGPDIDLYLPTSGSKKILNGSAEKRFSITMYLEGGSAKDRFDRYNSFKKYPVNQEVGDLLIVNETARGNAGSSLIAPADGDRRIFFRCTKPYEAIAGNLVVNTGCRVDAELRRHVFIEYGIEYQYLKDWRETHQGVLTQLDQVLSIKEIIKE